MLPDCYRATNWGVTVTAHRAAFVVSPVVACLILVAGLSGSGGARAAAGSTSGHSEAPSVAGAATARTATARGADLIGLAIVEGPGSPGCQDVVHVTSAGIASLPTSAGCAGNYPAPTSVGSFRPTASTGVHGGLRLARGESAGWNMQIWDLQGRLRSTILRSVQSCTAPDVPTGWRVLCVPLSATSFVAAQGGARAVVRAYSTTRAPRAVATVRYLAGGLVSHDSRTLFAWTSTGADLPTRPPTATRDRVVAITLPTGRQRVLAVAPTGYQYRLSCVTWTGTLIATKEQRVGSRTRDRGLVSITSAGRVRNLSERIPSGLRVIGCTADARTLILQPASSVDYRIYSFDRRTSVRRMIGGFDPVSVDNG